VGIDRINSFCFGFAKPLLYLQAGKGIILFIPSISPPKFAKNNLHYWAEDNVKYFVDFSLTE